MLDVLSKIVLVELALVILFSVLGCLLFFIYIIKMVIDTIRGDGDGQG